MSASAKEKQQKLDPTASVRDNVLIISPYYLLGLSRVHFSDNLSQNSCIKQLASVKFDISLHVRGERIYGRAVT